MSKLNVLRDSSFAVLGVTAMACAPEIDQKKEEVTCAIQALEADLQADENHFPDFVGQAVVRVDSIPLKEVPGYEEESLGEHYTVSATVSTDCIERGYDACLNGETPQVTCEAEQFFPVDYSSGWSKGYEQFWLISGVNEDEGTITELYLDRDYELVSGELVPGSMHAPLEWHRVTGTLMSRDWKDVGSDTIEDLNFHTYDGVSAKWAYHSYDYVEQF